MLKDFVETARNISATTKKNTKREILASYLRSLDDASLEAAALFFTGSAFPARDQRVTGVGWSTIADAVVAATGTSHDELFAESGRHGDLGDGVEMFFPPQRERDVSILEIREIFDHVASTSGKSAKTAVLISLFSRLTGAEARFVTKILLGEVRIGLQLGLVEEAIAEAFGEDLAAVRRAHMFSGDIGVAALLARSHALDSAALSLFHPIGFMLAQPEETSEGIIEQLGAGAIADDKYDGIRAQLHWDGTRVAIYSRTLDDVTARFPEVASAASGLAHPALLDGEIVAFRDRILPFATLQTRMGRRKPAGKLLEEAPVAFFAFDILYFDGESLFDTPLRDRLEKLRLTLPPTGAIRLANQCAVASAAEIEAAFASARRRVNEGLVVKDPSSFYTPGRRGKAWLKYKKALATLDCAVTAAEWGHGKRRGVLSDYTFAVRSDGQLLNIGKAYTGLTDAEIESMTRHFLERTRSKHGPVHVVEPDTVVEIAFDRIQESGRHKSGFALRFPRIVRIRHDKTIDQISTLDEVRRIYEGQLKREGEGEQG